MEVQPEGARDEALDRWAAEMDMSETVDEAAEMDMGLLGSLEPEPIDVASSMLLQQLGSMGRSYKREVRRGFKALVSEIYSPPRVTAELRRSKYKFMLPGFALDISGIDEDDGQPWNFCIAGKRDKVRRMVNEQKPFMLIGCPPCKAYSTWQALNESKSSDPAAYRRAKMQAGIHLAFVASLYKDQIEGGRYFIHEHPKWATSWGENEIDELMSIPGVEVAHGDQCQYGAEVSRGPRKGSPILKPTGFMTNSAAVHTALSHRCQGKNGECSRGKGGRHAHCEGRIASDAAIYPKGLCRAMLRGTAEQLRLDGHIKNGCFGIQPLDDDAEGEVPGHGPAQGYSGKYKDATTGQILR